MGNTGINSKSYKASGGKLSSSGGKVSGHTSTASSGSSSKTAAKTVAKTSSTPAKTGLSASDMAGTSPYSKTAAGAAKIAAAKGVSNTPTAASVAKAKAAGLPASAALTPSEEAKKATTAAKAKAAGEKATAEHNAAVAAKKTTIKETVVESPTTEIKTPSEDLNIKDVGAIDATSADLTPPTYDIKEDTKKADEAYNKFKGQLDDVSDVYKQSQEVLTKAANDKYNAELEALTVLETTQKDIAAKRDALIESASGVQKQELDNTFAANEKALEKQREKSARAYQDLQDEQATLNRQRQVREETAMGMIYGFGSVAASKNIEDSIIKGEKALTTLKKDAIDADDEFQMQIINLTKEYETAHAKINQWKAEQQNDTYSELQQYIAQISASKITAAAEKEQLIAQAVVQYNTQVGALNTTAAEARYQLSLGLIDKANEYKQLNFENQLKIAQEERTQAEADRKKALEDLDLSLKSIAGLETTDYSSLDSGVKSQIEALVSKLGLSAVSSEGLYNTYKAAMTSDTQPEFQYETDNDGNVTAISYDPDSGTFKTYDVGKVGKTDYKFTDKYNPSTGLIEPFNETKGEFVTSSSSGVTTGGFAEWASSYGTPTQNFNTKVGYFKDGRTTHGGYDFAGAINSDVTSPTTGTIIEVTNANDGSGWGNSIVIDDGINNWRLAHFNSLKVGMGAEVAKGQVLGKLGNTGYVLKGDGTKPTQAELAAGKGTHLHVEVKDKNGKLIDPMASSNTPQQNLDTQAMIERLVRRAGTETERNTNRNLVNQYIKLGITDEAALTKMLYGTELTPAQADAAKELRTQLGSQQGYKDMLDIQNGLLGAKAGLAQKNGYGDIAAINSFQRMVDPGATVREGDVALLQTASALFDRVDFQYILNTWTKGDKLPQAVRDRMMKTAKDLYDTKASAYNNSVGKVFKDSAKANNVLFNLIGTDFAKSTDLLDMSLDESQKMSLIGSITVNRMMAGKELFDWQTALNEGVSVDEILEYLKTLK